MAQQINLHTPLLLAPRHRFSARAMGSALAVMAVLLALACGVTLWMRQGITGESAQMRQAQQAERQQLERALQRARLDSDPQQLTRQVQGAALEVARLREQLLAQDSHRLPPGQRHSTLLALIARSVPDNAWVTELQLQPRSVAITGVTLDPSALRAWIQRLGTEPALAGQPVVDLKVQQLGVSRAGLQAEQAGSERALQIGAVPPGPAWAFRMVAQRPLVDAAALSQESQP